jgi:hypothetical protein
VTLIVSLLLLAVLLVWLFAPGAQASSHEADPVEPIDADELEAAEREVRELGIEQRPEDGFEGDDWGPGAGRQRGDRD